MTLLSTTVDETVTATTHVGARDLPARPSARDTVSQSLAMAWRATKKMRRNPEQFFDVTIQPLLFTAMFAYIFGGAISGSVADYLPIIIPGILAQTALTACMATGIQLREDMDKGVFDRFKSLPIARIAPLAGPAIADLLRYATAADADDPHRASRWATAPAAGSSACVAGWLLDDHRGLVAGLDLHLARHGGSQRPGRAGHLDDDHVPADLPVQRLRPGRHPAGLARRRSSTSTRSATSSPRSATCSTRARSPPRSAGRCSAARSWSAVFLPLSVRSYSRKM